MAITIKAGPNQDEVRYERRALHFGSQPLADPAKDFIVIKDAAPHHGKIFWGQNGYTYVTLTGQPTYLFRAGARLARAHTPGMRLEYELNPFFPQCLIREGDRLGIGSSLIEIVVLTHLGDAKATIYKVDLEAEDGVRIRLVPVPRPSLQEVGNYDLASLARQLRRYTDRTEVIHQAADWLGRTLAALPGTLPSNFQQEVRWWRLVDFGDEFPRGPSAGHGLTPASVDLGRLLKEKLTTGTKASPNQEYWVTMGEPFLVHVSGKGAELGICLALDYGGKGVEGLPAYLFTVSFRRPLRNEYVRILYDFGQIVSDSLSLLSIRRALLEWELDSDIASHILLPLHDTKKPLAAILACIEDVVSGREPPARKLEKARQECHFVRQLLQWNMDVKLDMDTREPDPYKHRCRRVNTALDKYLRYMSPDLFSRFKKVEPAKVSCEPFSIYRILVQLVENAEGAFKTTIGQVELWLETTRRLDEETGRTLEYVVLRVLDNGPGMSPERVQNIFQSRVIQAKRRGLGTAIVARLVQRHDGFIEVASAKGIGTAISVYLPRLSKAELPADDPDLKPYKDYAHARYGLGRWSGFTQAAQDFPEYTAVLQWMPKPKPAG